MTRISRVERPSLLGVSSQMPSSADQFPTPQATGTTQQRHTARVDQQYALAQYAAQQQYYQGQRAAYPQGDLPHIRDIAREGGVQSAPVPQPATNEELVAQARQRVRRHADGELTNAELMKALVTLFRAS